MISFGAPAFLAAGAALALAAVILHLITSTPPRRAPLPTARFLTPTRASAVRMQRRPTDLVLLLIRMLFALAIGAAFAQPVWTPAAVGTTHILLLDRGAGMGRSYDAALDTLRALTERIVADDVVIVVFDTVARIATVRADGEDTFVELARAGAAQVESDYRIALDAVRRITRTSAALYHRVSLVTVPRWGPYRAGTAAARRAAWPGVITLVAVPAPRPDSTVRTVPRMQAGAGTPLADAAAALGWAPVADDERASVVIQSASVAEPGGWRAVDAGDGPDGVVVAGEWLLPVPADRVLEPAGDTTSRVAAVWRDGRVAAVAVVGDTMSGETPCRIITGFPLDSGWTTMQPWYPDLVRRLADACPQPAAAAGSVALDSGAVRILRGAGSDAERPGQRSGRPLGRPLLGLALLLAAMEWPLRNRRRTVES
jgi:hypothetical protein